MTWRNVMIKDGEHLRLKLDNLEVEKAGQKYTIPLSDIATLTLEGEKMIITTSLLAKFAQHNIAVIICDSKYTPCGVYTSFGQYHHTAKRQLQQMDWSDRLRETIWTEIIYQKIHNQIAVLEWKELEEERLDLMNELLAALELGDKTNREGLAAKVYFNSLYGMDFRRDSSTVINAAMNYGYAIIRAYMARLVVGAGLIPTLGVFHHNEFNAFNLVDDLMEPFRPLMDWYIQDKILAHYKDYLSWEARCILIDFLNQPYLKKGKKTTLDLVMLDYVNSFIKAMNEGNIDFLDEISLEDLRGV